MKQCPQTRSELRLRSMPATSDFNTNPPSACGVENATDNAGDTPTLALARDGSVHGAECNGGWLPARFELGRTSVFRPSPSRAGTGLSATRCRPRISMRAGDSGATLELRERGTPTDGVQPPSRRFAALWLRPREQSTSGSAVVGCAGGVSSVSSDGPTEGGISISDHAFVKGENGPVPVLRLRDEVERARAPLPMGSGSYSRSGTAS